MAEEAAGPAKKKRNPEDDAMVMVRLRNHFYRDNYRRVVSALLFCIVVIIGCMGVIGYLITQRPSPKYFATTTDGRLIRMIPLSRPNQADATVLQWANNVAVSAYTYSYVDYRRRLQGVSQYFTNSGWKHFLKAVKSSNNLKTVIAKKLVVTAVASGAPVIQKKGRLNGRFVWLIQMPMLATFESASTKATQRLMVTMRVLRVSTVDNPKGIAVSSFAVDAS